jgi:hypothetical protein
MLISIDRQLRRHRRRALIGLAVLAIAGGALAAHVALMSGADTHMTNAAGICLILGGGVAVLAVAAVAIRRLAQRPVWLLALPAAPDLAVRPTPRGVLVRAGPSPLLQVFRL